MAGYWMVSNFDGENMEVEVSDVLELQTGGARDAGRGQSSPTRPDLTRPYPTKPEPRPTLASTGRDGIRLGGPVLRCPAALRPLDFRGCPTLRSAAL